MNATEIAVVVGGIAVIAALAWYFFAPRRAVGAKLEAGRQTVDIAVRGGYSPNLVRIEAGKPVRLRFDRQENSDCSARVVFPTCAGARRWRRSGPRPSTWTSPDPASTPGPAA